MKKMILSLMSVAIISLLIFSESQAQAPDDKLSPSLAKVLRAKQDQERVKVAIWIYTDSIKAADAVAKRYPQAKLIGQRPGKETDIPGYFIAALPPYALLGIPPPLEINPDMKAREPGVKHVTPDTEEILLKQDEYIKQALQIFGPLLK